MKHVIGLSGKMGSGKTVVSDYLRTRYGARQMRFSKILMDVLERLHMPLKRESLQKLGHGLRISLGEDVIVNAARGDIESESSDFIVIDGVRYPNEVDMIKEFEGGLIIYIDAPAKVRYLRCVERGEKGESEISFEQFLAAEEMETERHLDEIAKLADHTIENTSSIEELRKKIDDILGG